MSMFIRSSYPSDGMSTDPFGKIEKQSIGR
jgi:hypothetical protein